MTEKKRTKTRMPASERREQILQCAIHVFAGSGYHPTRLSDIAQEAGISEAMIYKHFPKKKTIFIEALKYMSGRLAVFWSKELGKEEDALVLLRNLVLEYHHRANEHPDELKLQFVALSEANDPEILEQLQFGHKAIREFVIHILNRGIAQGVIKKEINVDALTYLNIAGGALTHTMTMLSLENEYTEKTALAAVDHLIESIKT